MPTKTEEPDLTFLLRRSTQLAAEKRGVCPSCGKEIKHREGLAWCVDRQMSERTLQNRVIARAKRRGWVVAHVGKGWVGDLETGEGQYMTPMMPGWPDLFLLNPKMDPPRLAIELKREEGKVEEVQWQVLRLLISCGIPAAVIRPSDLRKGRVSAILNCK